MILIKSEKNQVKNDLATQKETIEVRLKSFEKQESILKARLTEIQAKLMESFKSKGASAK